MPPDPPTKLLDVKQTATELGISERTIRRLIWRRELPSVRIGDRVLIRPVDLAAFVEGKLRA